MSRSTQTICAMSSKCRRWRLQPGGEGAHPDHRPDNRHIPQRNPAPGHRRGGRSTVAYAVASWSSPCRVVQQLVGWNRRRIRQERGPKSSRLAHQAHVSAAWLDEFRNGQAIRCSSAGRLEPARSRQPPAGIRRHDAQHTAAPQKRNPAGPGKVARPGKVVEPLRAVEGPITPTPEHDDFWVDPVVPTGAERSEAQREDLLSTICSLSWRRRSPHFALRAPVGTTAQAGPITLFR